MNRTFTAFLLVSLLLVNGCLLGGAVAVTEHAIRKGVSSKKEHKNEYEQYKAYIESVNFHRENNSLPPLPVLTKEEWTRQQALLKKIEEDQGKQ